MSTLVATMPSSADARRRLPAGTGTNQSPFAVMVARTHRDGLERAQDFARQVACDLVPPTIRILGLVLVADAKERPSKDMRRLAKVVSSTYQRTWHVPWVPEWREERPDPAGPLPPEITRLATELAALTGANTSPR